MVLSHWLLLAVAALTPWQLYIVGTGLGTISLVQLSLGLLVALAFARGLIRPAEPLIPVNPPFLLLTCFCGLLTLSIAWSPDRMGAAKTVIKVAGILIVAMAVGTSKPTMRRKAVTTLALSSTALAVAVVAFRLVPEAEMGFLLSPAARFVVDPDLLGGLVAGRENANVLDAAKAGAVFTNANVASLFFGTVMFLAVSAKLRGALLTVIVTAHLAAVLATGSKAGLTALVVTGSVWCVCWVRERRTFKRVALFALGTFAVAIGLVLFIVATELWKTAESAAVSRLEVWGVAFDRLLQSPIMGLGFGGWERWIWSTRPLEGVFIPYPIHNLFLIAWSWAGVGAALLISGFAVAAIAAPWRVRIDHPVLADTMSRLSLSLAFSWFVIQSMFTNAALTDIRIGMPIGMTLGMLASVPRRVTTVAR